jgi:hypothetical protein
VQYIYPTVGLSAWHAFTLKVERRFQNGLGWIVSYARSKWIDNVNFDSSSGGSLFSDNRWPQNIYNMAAERSLSTTDIPHRLVAAPIIELPFGKGKRFLNQGGVVNAILGGWEVSTIGTLQSGPPFGSSVLNGARDLLGELGARANVRPNLIGNANSPNQGQPAVAIRGMQWITSSAFAAPALYNYGNAARTLPGVRGPGLVNFDTMLAKSFRVAERWRAQFRWELFNASNTPAWGVPAADLGGGNFGVSTPGGRRVMQFGLKLYY